MIIGGVADPAGETRWAQEIFRAKRRDKNRRTQDNGPAPSNTALTGR